MAKVALALLGSFLVPAWAAFGEDVALKGGVFTPAARAPDFSLRASDGAELTLERYRGKVVLLAFGFTSCADVCPVTLAILAHARRMLGSDAADVQVVYVTVDPETDTATRLREHLALYDATFIGGTGGAEELAAVRSSYGVLASETADQPGGIAHSSSVYFIDRRGMLRALMPYGRTAEDFAHDLRALLKEAP